MCTAGIQLNIVGIITVKYSKDGTCYPAIGTIAKDLKLSRRTVQRAIADLEQSGHLIKEQRWRENGGKSSLLFTVK